MYLRRVEIFGFKSFPEKLVLEPSRGMTAIVGPNGCGKTNVSDAVRWALGEHNIRTLRGKVMEDIIFNGAPKRDPLGMCEVTLTFADASDDVGLEEMSITRRAFRSGESEFFLNGTPCRLKEITDKFLDRGLGHRGYAIIERELVDKVLEDASRERRALIEEAAGIARYKARERAARRKLELTDQDLARIQDIVGEVEKRVDTLRRQVGKAERYKELEAELNAGEERLLRMEYRALAARGASLAGERRGLELRREGVRIEMRTLETDREAVRAEREEAERALAQAEAEVGAVSREAAELEGRVRLLRERERSLTAEIERSRDEAAAHAARRSEALRRHEEGRNEELRLRNEIAGLAEAREAAVAELAQLDARDGELSAELEEKRRAGLAALEERVSRSKEVQAHTRELEENRSEMAELAEAEEALTVERRRHETDLAQRGGVLERLTAAIAAAEEERSQARIRLGVIEQEKAEREVRERELSAELGGLEANLGLLRELEERLEGFSGSVQSVLHEARSGGEAGRGVYGVVGELLGTAEERVAVALEAALAEGMDCVVTHDLESARALVQFLREGRRGRATFLPLGELNGHGPTRDGGNGHPFPEGVRGEDGVLGPALDFVSCDDAHRPVARYLLGNTVVARDLATAERLARKGEYGGLRFVTLAGECYRAPGVVTGGSTPEGEMSPFNRGRRIHELERRVDEARATLAEAAALRERVLEELENLKRRLLELESELEMSRAEAEEERGELRRIEGLLAGTAFRATQLEEERRRLEADRERVGSMLTQLVEEHRALEESGRAAEGILQELERQARELAGRRETTRGRIHATDLDSLTRRERMNALIEERPRLENEAEVSAASEARQRDAAAEAARVVEELRAEIAKEEAAYHVFAGEVEVRGKRRDEARSAVADVAARERGIEQDLGAKRDQASSLGEELHGIELSGREVEVELESLKRRAPEGFDFEADAAAPPAAATRTGEEPDRDAGTADEGASSAVDGANGATPAGSAEELTESVTALRARLDTVREKIQRLGPVNFVALEEHETEKDRLDFLTQQRDDLVRSRDQLLEAARRINRTARGRFLETFDQVRSNFQETFKLLFDDGIADITLAEGGDPLECPIEIMARPRGKALREVSLLSGGERALSAISLLVALYKVKPSPFCILDEVDAPLDDSNVRRYTQMLHRLRENTQFLVITHNKRTMEAAESLYGVTMEEAGVSTVVGVKLEEAHRWAVESRSEAEPAAAAPVAGISEEARAMAVEALDAELAG